MVWIPKVTNEYVVYKNTQGKDTKISLASSESHAVFKDSNNIVLAVANAFRHNVKCNKSYLTPQEASKMTESVYLSASQVKHTRANNPLASYDRLIKQCTDKNSDGGENITQHEQSLILECLHNWLLPD